MDDLIVRRLRGEATDIEIRRLDQWRAAAEENERAYREVVRLWERSGELTRTGVPSPPGLDRVVEAAERRRKRAGRRTVLRSPWLGRAAVVAVLASSGYLAFGPGRSPVPGITLTPLESSLGSHQVMTMSLSDGSVVRAAPETHLEFPSATDRRRVVLDGRAFFAVAHGDLPFQVQTPVGTVTVTGTRFEVTSAPGGIRVVVVEGTVQVANDQGTAQVRAGQVAFLTQGSTARILEHADVWTLLDWSGGLLIFQATPLRQVAAEVSMHFGVTVRVSDDDVGRRRITAWFEGEPLEDVVSALCIVADARCEMGETEVTIGS
jgi:transmembrane sensor